MFSILKLPVNDEVGPQVADHPGDLPVQEGEVEDAGREQVDQLVSMGDPPVDHKIRYFKMFYQIFAHLGIGSPGMPPGKRKFQRLGPP